MALLDLLVHALQDRLLLDALDLLLLDDAAEAVVLRLAVAEVDATGNSELVSNGLLSFVAVVSGKVGLTLSRHNQ